MVFECLKTVLQGIAEATTMSSPVTVLLKMCIRESKQQKAAREIEDQIKIKSTVYLFIKNSMCSSALGQLELHFKKAFHKDLLFS